MKLFSVSRVVPFLFCGVCLGGSWFCALQGFSSHSTASQPSPLEPSEGVLQLGKIAQGMTHQRSIQLTNRSHEPIRIVSLGHSCQCSQSDISATLVVPGEKTELTVTFDAGQSRGAAHADVRINFRIGDDEREFQLVLPIVAEVEPDIAYSPDQLTFRADEPSTQYVSLTPYRLSEFEIQSAVANHAAFSVEVKSDKAASPRQVAITFQLDQWDSSTARATLMIRTSSTNEPVLRIPLTVAGD